MEPWDDNTTMGAKEAALALTVLSFAPGEDFNKFYSATEVFLKLSRSYKCRSAQWKVLNPEDVQNSFNDSFLRKSIIKACGDISFMRSSYNNFLICLGESWTTKAPLKDADLKIKVSALVIKISQGMFSFPKFMGIG